MAVQTISTTHSSFPPLAADYSLYRGNYLGRELRLICEDTRGLFPASAKSHRSYVDRMGRPRRFLSEYIVEYEKNSDKYSMRPGVQGQRRPRTEPVKMPSMKEITHSQRGKASRKGNLAFGYGMEVSIVFSSSIVFLVTTFYLQSTPPIKT